jgi:2,4-dienoyl-CoA reductase-like NADH-dependent reductase (Old Yellow Enzyme family)
MTEYPRLLSGLTLRSTPLKNRMVMTAHTTGYGWEERRDDGTRQIAYLERRAAGGAGLIINNPMHAGVVVRRDYDSRRRAMRRRVPSDTIRIRTARIRTMEESLEFRHASERQSRGRKPRRRR